MRTIYLDSQFLNVSPQTIEALAPGSFKAKGVFETMLGLDTVVIDAGAHLKRLRLGLKKIGIKAPSISPCILREVLRRNQLSMARVRLMVWQAGKQTHVMIMALPYKNPNKRIYRVCFIKTDCPAHARMANVKSLDHGLFAEGYAHARKHGFDEALLLNRQGYIREASRANIFWTKDRILYTPPLSSGCLNGITRQQVIKQARKLGIPVKERNLTLEILKKSDAAFLTNSLIGVQPIEPE